MIQNLAGENFGEFVDRFQLAKQPKNIFSKILAQHTECIQYGTSILQYIIRQEYRTVFYQLIYTRIYVNCLVSYLKGTNKHGLAMIKYK